MQEVGPASAKPLPPAPIRLKPTTRRTSQRQRENRRWARSLLCYLAVKSGFLHILLSRKKNRMEMEKNRMAEEIQQRSFGNYRRLEEELNKAINYNAENNDQRIPDLRLPHYYSERTGARSTTASPAVSFRLRRMTARERECWKNDHKNVPRSATLGITNQKSR